MSQIEEKYQVKYDGRGQDGIAAEKIHFDLHRVAQPAEDINVVPTLFVITAWRIIVNANLVVEVLVEFRIKLGLQNLLQDGKLGLFFGLKRFGIVQHLAVAIAQDVGGKPAVQAQHARLESGGENRLHQCLAGFVIFAADGSVVAPRQLLHGGDVHGQVGSAIGEGHAF